MRVLLEKLHCPLTLWNSLAIIFFSFHPTFVAPNWVTYVTSKKSSTLQLSRCFARTAKVQELALAEGLREALEAHPGLSLGL